MIRTAQGNNRHPDRRVALDHPNVITIYDINVADGIDYIAMELVPGQTLEDQPASSTSICSPPT